MYKRPYQILISGGDMMGVTKIPTVSTSLRLVAWTNFTAGVLQTQKRQPSCTKLRVYKGQAAHMRRHPVGTWLMFHITKWAPITSDKWGFHPYKWLYKWVSLGFCSPLSVGISCQNQVPEQNSSGWKQCHHHGLVLVDPTVYIIYIPGSSALLHG